MGAGRGGRTPVVGQDNYTLREQLFELRKNLEEALEQRVPAGCTVGFTGATAPDGWLLCDGAAVNRAKYAALFKAIGTAEGAGDGYGTFNVPNTADTIIKT